MVGIDRLWVLVALLLLCSQATAQTTTAAVSGLVRDKNTRATVPNVTVVLGADENKGGQLIPDVTTFEGVYNLSTTVYGSIDNLYVWSNKPYHSRPLKASLDPELKGVRRAKPPALDVLMNTASPLAQEEVVYIFVCIEETESVKTKLFVQTASATEERVRVLTAEALARFPDAYNDTKLNQIIDSSDNLADKTLVPARVVSREQIVALRNSDRFRAAFARTRRVLEQTKHYLRATSPVSPEVLDFAVSVGPTLIDPTWFEDQAVCNRVQNTLHQLERERGDHWFDVVSCDNEERPAAAEGLIIKEGHIAPEELGQWVARNREGGRYVLLSALITERKLPKAQWISAWERLRHIRPVIVPLGPNDRLFPKGREKSRRLLPGQ